MDEQKNINNAYDFSNVVVDSNLVTYLFKVCEDYYNRLIKTEEIEEEKNEKLKIEYRNYSYKKDFRMGFTTKVVEKSNEYSYIEITNLDSYNEFLNAGRLNNVSSIKMILNLSYDRVNGMDSVFHENEFEIVLKPYEISFVRKGNFVDEGMDLVEKTIVDTFNGYTKVNTIFCTK